MGTPPMVTISSQAVPELRDMPASTRTALLFCLVAVTMIITLDTATPLTARAQSSGGDQPPRLTTIRYDEDYSYLRDPGLRTGAWWEPFKYVPLNQAGDIYLTFGGEARLRYEWIKGNNWGEGPAADDGYLWYRALPYADLHLGRYVRVFGQLVVAFADDKEPSVTPVDETGVDLLQGFIDLSLPVTSDASMALRGGRQMLLYGSERLIGIRYGPNVPRSFDGLKGMAKFGEWRVDASYVRPVAVGLRSFDDETDNGRSLWALYATRVLPFGEGTGVDSYYIGYQNKNAVFNQGAGEELRHTLGARLFGTAYAWNWNLEGFYQFGDFADGNISAWSVASDVGFTFANAPFRPRVGLKANVISGDDNATDRDLQTFNALFPKGKYFGELSLLGPSNLINLHPSISIALGAGWSFSIASAFYWRQSTGDGIYDNAGNLIRGDVGSKARYIGTQVEAVLEYEYSRNLAFLVSYSQFLPGRYIKQTGPSKTVHFIGTEVEFRF
jgi:Alginate export